MVEKKSEKVPVDFKKRLYKGTLPNFTWCLKLN